MLKTYRFKFFIKALLFLFEVFEGAFAVGHLICILELHIFIISVFVYRLGIKSVLLKYFVSIDCDLRVGTRT